MFMYSCFTPSLYYYSNRRLSSHGPRGTFQYFLHRAFPSTLSSHPTSHPMLCTPLTHSTGGSGLSKKRSWRLSSSLQWFRAIDVQRSPGLHGKLGFLKTRRTTSRCITLYTLLPYFTTLFNSTVLPARHRFQRGKSQLARTHAHTQTFPYPFPLLSSLYRHPSRCSSAIAW